MRFRRVESAHSEMTLRKLFRSVRPCQAEPTICSRLRRSLPSWCVLSHLPLRPNAQTNNLFAVPAEPTAPRLPPVHAFADRPAGIPRKLARLAARPCLVLPAIAQFHELRLGSPPGVRGPVRAHRAPTASACWLR